MVDLIANDDQVKRAVAYLKEQVPEAIKIGIRNSTRYIIVGKGSASDVKYNNAICHAAIGSQSEKYVYCVGTEIGIERRISMYPHLNKNLFAPYLNFITTDPIWAPYIRAITKYGVVVDAACPQKYFQAFLICSRMFWEAAEDSFELFNTAVDRGIPPRIALLYAFHNNVSTRSYTMSTCNGRTFSQEACALQPVTGHRPFQMVSYEDMRRFLKVKEATGASYHGSPSTKGVTDMLGDGPLPYVNNYPILTGLFGELYRSERFKEALRVFRAAGEPTKKYSPPNPFKGPKADEPRPLYEGQVTIREWKNVVLEELCNEFVREAEFV